MTKENQNHDQRLLDLPCNFIKSLTLMDAKLFKKLSTFFKEEYISLSHLSEFEANECRLEWVNNISYLETLALTFKGYSSKEIDMAFKMAFMTLNKNRQSVLQGKEASND